MACAADDRGRCIDHPMIEHDRKARAISFLLADLSRHREMLDEHFAMRVTLPRRRTVTSDDGWARYQILGALALVATRWWVSV